MDIRSAPSLGDDIISIRNKSLAARDLVGTLDFGVEPEETVEEEIMEDSEVVEPEDSGPPLVNALLRMSYDDRLQTEIDIYQAAIETVTRTHPKVVGDTRTALIASEASRRLNLILLR